MKALLVSALGLACVGFLVAARLATVAGQAMTMDVGVPAQDGFEEITIQYKPPGSAVTVDLPVTVTGINGKPNPNDPNDPPADTAAQKATKIINAINNAAAGPPPVPVSASGNPVGNVVTVAVPAGGEMKGLKKSNNTREKSTMAGDPEGEEIAQASFTLSGSAAGVNAEGGASQIKITIGDVERTFSVSPGMSITQLRRNIRDEFDAAGFRVSEAGDSVLVVLPANDPSASFWLNDATLTASSGLSIF